MKKQHFLTTKRSDRLLNRAILFSILLVITAGCNQTVQDGWNTYRSDNARSSLTSESLAFPLSLNWTHSPVHAPVTSWHEPAGELPRMHADNVYHVTSAEGIAYFGSPVDNKVYAIDVRTGDLIWSFFTDGPVRFAPTIFKKRIYVGSDDGHVYCLQAGNGKLVWKYRAGPSDEKIIGMGRMISLWPVRTSVLLDDGIAYFAAGVFPYEGLYICALDADDGSIVWIDNTTGDRAHELQYGGFSPQSYLVASEDILYVPSGRALPAAFDKKTGEFLFYTSPGDPGKGGGTWALLDGEKLVAGVGVYGEPAKLSFDGKTGESVEDVHAWFPGKDMVVTPEISYTLTAGGIIAVDRKEYVNNIDKQKENETDQGRLGSSLRRLMMQRYYRNEGLDEQARNQLDEQINELNNKVQELMKEGESIKASLYKWNYSKQNLNTLILADNAVIAGGDGIVVALDKDSGEELWQDEIEGNAYGLSTTNGYLFVSTVEGPVYCYSEQEGLENKLVKPGINQSPYPEDKLTSVYESAAESILQNTGVSKGYCLVLGSGTGRLAYELAKRSELKIVGIEEDPGKTETAKKKLDEAGVYGSRVVVEQWELSSLPDCFANLIVSDEMLVSGETDFSAGEMYRVLRPFGGIAYFGQPENSPGACSINFQNLEQWLQGSAAPEPAIDKTAGAWAKIVRGEIEGAGSWTQQYANPQNTANSGDELVGGQLGVLWFGEPGPKGVLERHSRAASPVSMDGRLFIQGEEVIMAYDAYNGSLIWKREIPGAVRAMADVDCGNLTLTKDGLYVAAWDKCYRLDPASGETTRVYEIPASSDGSTRRWGYLTCSDGIVYGSSTTPLIEGYAAVYDNLVEDGKWRDTEELIPQYRMEMERLKSKYPVPNEEMRKELHRSGVLFRSMANWPRGGEFSIKGAVTENTQSASNKIFALDAETGKLLWEHDGGKIANITIALGDGKIFFAESSIPWQTRMKAINERHRLTKLGIYEERADILKDLKEAETEVAHLMKNENPDPRYVEKMSYRVNTLKAEMFREEHKQGSLEYKDADVRIITALDAVSGKKLWTNPVDLTGCCGDRMGTLIYDDMLFFAGNTGNHDAWRFWHGSLKWRRVMALNATNGEVRWSRALNYRTRPLILDDKLIIEPRACDPRTGEILTRTHPVTGKEVPWEFLRPGHTCAETAASADGLFYRSACTAIYDVTKDRGVAYFGALREGCLINMIPASGLVLIPEAASGCVCAYPIRTTVVLKRKEKRHEPWTVFITHGPMTPVKHFSINLGAPSDYKDDEGVLWFAYPNPNTHYNNHFSNYGVKFDLRDEFHSDMGYFADDAKSISIEGSDKPWLYSSGCLGLTHCEIPLIDDLFGEKEGVYTVRLGFKALPEDRNGKRVFDIRLQDEVLLEDFDIRREAGSANNIVIKEFTGIPVKNLLTLNLVSKKAVPNAKEAPLINFIEVIREDLPEIAGIPESAVMISRSEAERILQQAETELDENNAEAALEKFHRVLDAAVASPDQKQRALEGIAVIASPKSLSRLTAYCRDVTPMPKGFKEYTRHLDLISFGKYKELDPNRPTTPKRKVESIVWDYDEPGAELMDSGVRTFVAIANKLAGTDKEKAIRMLNYALDYANEDIHKEIVSSLNGLGVEVGSAGNI